VLADVAVSDLGLLRQQDGSGRAQLWPHRHNTDAMSITLLQRV
jgi:16S rRNA (cytosine967-C5)-methyltransferase